MLSELENVPELQLLETFCNLNLRLIEILDRAEIETESSLNLHLYKAKSVRH